MQLKVLGKVFDHVCNVSLVRKDNDEESIIDHWTAICRLGVSLDKYPTREQTTAVLGRTLNWHRLFEGRDVGYYDNRLEFEKFHGLLVKGNSIREIKESTARGIATILQGAELVLCISKEGYIGMAFDRTQPADKIALLSGGPLPFVLRPHGEHYQIFGACYVHGIMDGEAWTEDETELKETILH
ncbi:hypothetical protein BDZ45DRAFT_244837 [Acephala macrosclerotiorum]|nr:hypothetical protein BDZ45DRAFT_244837 [Acephala macrosclerotiorum]